MPDGNVDDALTKASELAGDLAEDVGASADAADRPGGDPAPLSRAEADGLGLDDQLEQVEQHLARAREEVSDQPDASASLDSSEPMDFRAAAAALADDVTPPAGTETQTPDAPVDGAAPESVGDGGDREPSGIQTRTGTVVRLGKRQPPPPQPKPDDETAQVSEGAGDTEKPGDDGGPVFGGADVGGAVAQDLGPPEAVNGSSSDEPGSSGSPRAAAALDMFCKALEFMDAPFQRLGPRPRQVIGWVALAMIFAAFLVVMLSVFE
jgi:hypothetical protein